MYAIVLIQALSETHAQGMAVTIHPHMHPLILLFLFLTSNFLCLTL